jgi:hypothetical protein
MKKPSSVAKTGSHSSDLFLQRVSKQITPDQYVRALDARVSDRRKDEERHRRKK